MPREAFSLFYIEQRNYSRESDIFSSQLPGIMVQDQEDLSYESLLHILAPGHVPSNHVFQTIFFQWTLALTNTFCNYILITYEKVLDLCKNLNPLFITAGHFSRLPESTKGFFKSCLSVFLIFFKFRAFALNH